MKQLRATGLLLLSACALVACSTDPSYDPADLPPAEVFDWGGQPISVSPPPDSWYREKEQSGGLRGVRFVKTRSVGEAIGLGEHYSLSDRDRCARLTSLLGDLDNLDLKAFRLRVQRARPYASPPISREEERVAKSVNIRLDQAFDAFYNQDPIEARTAVGQALEQAKRIRYSLDEVVGRVMFSADAYDSFGTVEVAEPIDRTVAGRPSISVDFTLDRSDRELLFHGRQVYTVENNRLFVFTFFGLPENLPLFDAILETVAFPPGQCTH